MKCHEARELLIHYSNGEMGRSERELLQAHLAHCEACSRHLKSLSAVEQQVRTGLRQAADAAEPPSMAWQELSHKLARGRTGRGTPRSTSHPPVSPVWRLMGGLSATLALAALVVAAIVSPQWGFNQKPLAVTENALPLDAASKTNGIQNAAVTSSDAQPDPAQAGAPASHLTNATPAQSIGVSPQRQVRALLQSEPDSFLSKSQIDNEPELEFVAQLTCSYCLRMR